METGAMNRGHTRSTGAIPGNTINHFANLAPARNKEQVDGISVYVNRSIQQGHSLPWFCMPREWTSDRIGGSDARFDGMELAARRSPTP